jgi:4-alpha-glucanotransferase
MTVWWAQAPVEERRAVLDTRSIRERLGEAERVQAISSPELSPAVRAALLEALFASGANLLILPIQDAFGWSDRINQPATIGDHNWTWRLPWPVDRMSTEVEAAVVSAQLRKWSEQNQR